MRHFQRRQFDTRIIGTGMVLALLWGGVSSSARAQAVEDEDLALVYGDKATVSLATGSKQTVRRAPAVATVITAEDIAAMGATDIDQVLETVPGLHINRHPSMGATQYVMRGVFSTYTPQVLMLQNGIPVTVAVSGNKGSLWGGLPVENIARIEVLRGPGSALYGADAFAGVINIITKTANDIQGTQYGLRVGSFASRDAWVLHGGRLGSIDTAAYLRVGTTDGFKRTVEADAQTRNDRGLGTHASLAPGGLNAGVDTVDAGLDLAHGKWRWRAGYKLRDNLETFGGMASVLDPVGRGRSERVTSDLSWTDPQLGKDWSASADASVMHYRQSYPTPGQLFPPGTRFPTGTFDNGMIGAPEFAERQLRLSASAVYTGFANHSLRFGLGHDDLDLYQTREYRNFTYSPSGIPIPAGALVVTPTPFLLPQLRKVNYLYIQDEWTLARDWILTAGVRRDDYSDSGVTTNPRLALVWDISLDLTAKLLYGSAFRAPAFTEQYATNNPIGAGNPNIQPEKTRTVEAALAWQAQPNLSLNVNFFHYDMKDIIRATANPAPVPGSTFNNTGSQHGNGMELEGIWDATRSLRLTGHYSYQKSIDEMTGVDAGYAPRHHVYLRTDWVPATNWMLSGQANRVAGRQRAAGDSRPPVADYTTVDLTLRSTRQGKGMWNFAASLRNLFDADVREPSLAPGLVQYDLPGPGRQFWLQVTREL